MENFSAEIINNKIQTILNKVVDAGKHEGYVDKKLLREALHDTCELRNFMVSNGLNHKRKEINEIAFNISKTLNSAYKKKI